MPTEPFEELSLEQLRSRASVKWRAHPPDVLPLWIAEMDAGVAPSIVDTISSAARRGDLGYPPVDDSYAASYAAIASRRWDWDPDVGLAVPVADVLTGLRESLVAATAPGSGILLPTPVYHPLVDLPAQLGRRLVTVPLGADGRLDLEAIASALEAGGIGAILLCSPHNPTGVVHTAAELAAVAALAAGSGVEVVVDEIHALLVHGGEPFTPWLAVADFGLVVTSASKAYNMAGVKAGVVLAGAGSSAVFERFPETLRWGASNLGLMAHRAAWDGGDDWLAAVNDNIASNAVLLGELLAERLPAVGYVPPVATYLAWLDCRALGLGDDPAEHFLERARVALNSGPEFGPGGEGFVRLNLACSRSVLREAVERMAASLD